MKQNYDVLVIGGDKRQLYMAQALQNAGYQITLCAFGGHEGFTSLPFSALPVEDAIPAADAIILPLPVSRDQAHINAPFTHLPPKIETILHTLREDQIVLAGMMQEPWKSAFFKQGIRVYDYFEREELVISNAIPTAQGVLKLILEHVEFTLHGSHCAVTGYGTTAKVIARTLAALGAHVTVAARKFRDIAWARADGMAGIALAEFAQQAPMFEIVINTVPATVLDAERLARLPQDCLLIDIASAPYGIDFSAAEARGIPVIVAPSLPGKVAPKTAGHIISDTIDHIIQEVNQWNVQ